VSPSRRITYNTHAHTRRAQCRPLAGSPTIRTHTHIAPSVALSRGHLQYARTHTSRPVSVSPSRGATYNTHAHTHRAQCHPLAGSPTIRTRTHIAPSVVFSQGHARACLWLPKRALDARWFCHLFGAHDMTWQAFVKHSFTLQTEVNRSQSCLFMVDKFMVPTPMIRYHGGKGKKRSPPHTSTAMIQRLSVKARAQPFRIRSKSSFCIEKPVSNGDDGNHSSSMI